MKQKTLNQFLILAVIIVFIVSLTLAIILKKPTLVSRCGAIIILLGVIMEYRRILNNDKENQYTPGTPISLGATRQLLNVSPKDRKYRLISNIIVVLGTIISGYGDLCFNLNF